MINVEKTPPVFEILKLGGFFFTSIKTKLRNGLFLKKMEISSSPELVIIRNQKYQNLFSFLKCYK